MNKKNFNLSKLLNFIAIIMLLIVSFNFGRLHTSKIDLNVNDKNSQKFEQIMSILSNKWFFSKEYPDIKEHIAEKAFHAMGVDELDDHTAYFSKKESEEFIKNIENDFVGIGVKFYTTNGISIVKKVFKHSPANDVGIKAGDIFYKVNGIEVEGYSADKLATIVKGDEGTNVNIEFIRGDKNIDFNIIRSRINITVYGEIIKDNIGYLEISNFANNTAEELYDYLMEFKEANVNKIMIDLRGNGGGYLGTLINIASYFLDNDDIVLQQEYSNGSIDVSKANDTKFMEFNKIVILADKETASASEALILALKENRDDVVIVGETSFGKGTVQIRDILSDGSALKYTTARWLGPNGTSIHKTGIKPDYPESSFNMLLLNLDESSEDVVYNVDSVSTYVLSLQQSLKFLDYDIDREDGYFSEKTLKILNKFQKDNNLQVSDKVDKKVMASIYSVVIREINENKLKDNQYQKALELLHE